ncbi:MAG: response regulator transcription factor [Elusimicrobia bacterium]|nr:response regulator transcription factor [Elusimicrobiota bacterium]
MGETTKIVDLKTETKAKILVVDDEQDIASLIDDWLSDLFDVTVALNGKTAMQKAVWTQPQVVLLDVVLPDMGGYDVVRLLRGAPQTKDVPVIVMTAKNFDDSTIKLIKAEANVFGFLNKPFKPSELVKMIEAALKGSQSDSTVEAEVIVPPPPATNSVVEDVPVSVVEETKSASNDEPPSTLPDKNLKPPAKPKATVRHRADEDRPRGIGRLVYGAIKIGLALVFAGVLFFGAAEWAARESEEALGKRFFVPPVYPSSRFNAFLPYQWNNPKNTSPTYWEDGKAIYQFNQWGLRGQDFPLLPPAGVRRILLLGGSTVFGLGVRESDTLSHRLENRLNESRWGRFQVINAGLWALTPQEQWDYMKGQGLNFKPDAILWLCEPRQEGEPSSQGLRWLGSHRWWVVPPFSESRWIQLMVHRKIRSRENTSDPNNDALFKEAEKLTRDQKIIFHRWMLDRGDLKISGSARLNDPYMVRDADPVASFLDRLVDRLAPVVVREKTDGQPR